MKLYQTFLFINRGRLLLDDYMYEVETLTNYKTGNNQIVYNIT